jgi:hypothetical protein
MHLSIFNKSIMMETKMGKDFLPPKITATLEAMIWRITI